MTDYRPSSDMYSYLVKSASDTGVLTSHQLRQFLQDNAEDLTKRFNESTRQHFFGMQTPGAPNTCDGSEPGVIYSGGKPLVNALGKQEQFDRQCNVPGQACMMLWNNTPLPQQGPYCQTPPNSYYPSYSLLSDITPINTIDSGAVGASQMYPPVLSTTGYTGMTGNYGGETGMTGMYGEETGYTGNTGLYYEGETGYTGMTGMTGMGMN